MAVVRFIRPQIRSLTEHSKVLAASTHTHAISLGMLGLIVAALSLMTRWPRRLVNAGIAQGKNRSGLAWFLLSLLLGPIATFVLVAFFEKLPEHPR